MALGLISTDDQFRAKWSSQLLNENRPQMAAGFSEAMATNTWNGRTDYRHCWFGPNELNFLSNLFLFNHSYRGRK
jgi:hypothetical protein